MARKKVTTTVYLTEEQVAALKELHQRTRVPVAEYIRMGIDLILEKNANHLPGQESLFSNLSDESFGRKLDPIAEYRAQLAARVEKPE